LKPKNRGEKEKEQRKPSIVVALQKEEVGEDEKEK